MPFYARRIAYIIQNPMPNPHPRTKEEIMKSFNVMIDNLPSRVGETPRIVLENFILEILDEYGAGQRKHEYEASVNLRAGREKLIEIEARQKAFEEIEEIIVKDETPWLDSFQRKKFMEHILAALKNQNKTNT